MQTLIRTPILLFLGALLFGAYAAEQPAAVNESKINVRARPSLVGEVITQLQKGDQVTILDYVPDEDAKPGEPTNWAKIKLPPNTPVWVYGNLVRNSAVTASRLNLRAGPGDNYSVIGRIGRGDKITPIRTVGDWIEIEAPPIAYAFVDSTLITPSGPAAAVSPAPIATTAAPTSDTATNTSPETVQASAVPLSVPVTNAPPVETNQTIAATSVPSELQPATQGAATPAPVEGSPQSTFVPAQPVTSTQTVVTPRPAADFMLPELAKAKDNSPPQSSSTTRILAAAPVATMKSPEPAPASTPMAQNNTPPLGTEPERTKRVVRREGIIRPTISIQAPTWYELVHPQTKKRMEYLYADKLGIKLKQFRGQKVIVTGEEAVDPRWPNSPILELQTLDLAP